MDILEKIEQGKATLDDQDEALKDPRTAFWFAHDVPGADIERCQEVACSNCYLAYSFALDIPKANISKCIEACKGTKYEEFLNKRIMERALR